MRVAGPVFVAHLRRRARRTAVPRPRRRDARTERRETGRHRPSARAYLARLDSRRDQHRGARRRPDRRRRLRRRPQGAPADQERRCVPRARARRSRAGASMRGSGTTSSCSTGASPKVTPCACSAASSGSAGRLQVQVRVVEAAPEADPAGLTPTMRRDADELEGFLEFLVGEISHRELATATAGILLAGEVRSVAPRTSGRRPRRPSRLCRRAARAHGRRRDAVPRDRPAPPTPAPRPAARRSACSTTWGARSSSAEGHRSARRKRAASSGTSTSA